MTIKEALQWGIKCLAGSGTDSPTLDVEVILAYVLSANRTELYTHPSTALLSSELKAYKTLIGRRSDHEPVAYIVGHKEFYGLDFIVNRHTLIPRPETEIIVEEALRIARVKTPKLYVVDVGTGSGCIIIALAKTLSGACHFFATDISSQALKAAKLNAQYSGLGDRILFRKGNLFKPILAHLEKAMSQSQLLITANLPYLPTAQWRRAVMGLLPNTIPAANPDVRLQNPDSSSPYCKFNTPRRSRYFSLEPLSFRDESAFDNSPMSDVRYEPRQALDGGKDGLMYCRRLFEQLKFWRGRQKFASITVLAEIDPHQVDEFMILAKSFFSTARLAVKKDLAGLDRMAVLTLSAQI